MQTGRIESANIRQTKKRNPVTQGAKIGAGIAIAIEAADTFALHYNLKRITGEGLIKNFLNNVDDIIKTQAKEQVGNKKFKTALTVFTALAIAGVTTLRIVLGAAAGGGLGLLVKGHDEKKEAEKEEIIEQVKEELNGGEI